jgi:hypothetical protein
VRPDGIQEEANGMTEEKSHERHMKEETTSKAVAKPKLSAKARLANAPQPADGKLSKKSVAKLNLTTKHIRTALTTMENQLLSAVRSTCIAPQLVSKLTAEKAELEAELTAITMYTEDNQEVDTDKTCDYAKKKMDAVVQSFKVLKKMLKYDDMTIAAPPCDPAGSEVCTDDDGV